MEQQTEPIEEEKKVSEEDRLREEAAKRLERRRKKMLSPEERLARITGQPVGSVITADEMGTVEVGGSRSQSTAPIASDDPPLELLTRDPLAPRGSPGPESDLLSNLLGGANAPVENPVRFSHALWPLLALAVRLILETEYKFYIGESGVLPFLLLLPLLMVSGHLHLPSLRSTSLLSAALMLLGVDQAKIALLTRGLHLGSILLQCLSVYLFSFLVCHIIVVHIIDSIV